MLMKKSARVLALAACLGLLVPSMAMSATMNDTANSARTMTKAAKDMNDISKNSSQQNTQQGMQKAKPAPAKKNPPKKAAKQKAAPQDNRVRGG